MWPGNRVIKVVGVGGLLRVFGNSFKLFVILCRDVYYDSREVFFCLY